MVKGLYFKTNTWSVFVILSFPLLRWIFPCHVSLGKKGPVPCFWPKPSKIPPTAQACKQDTSSESHLQVQQPRATPFGEDLCLKP